MYFPVGKFKMTAELSDDLTLFFGVTDRTIQRQVNSLLALGWLQKNTKNGYFLIRGWSLFKNQIQSVTRLSYELSFNEINNMRAVIGAVIFGYLHRLYWRKQIRLGSVSIKGGTSKVPRGLFRYLMKDGAPIALSGVEKVLGIPKRKAQHLKELAEKFQYIETKAHLIPTDLKSSDIRLLKRNSIDTNHYRFVNGFYFIQNPDRFTINFTFCNRKLKYHNDSHKLNNLCEQ